jgi:hypothetical protein
MRGEFPNHSGIEVNPPVDSTIGMGQTLTLPFGVVGDLFVPIPRDAAKVGSIFPTVTDGNDRQGDKD